MFLNLFRLTTLAAGVALVGALAVGTRPVKADAMDSMASCTAMHSAMTATHQKMSSMKSTGDADKDYMAAMPMMAKAMMEMNAYEMKCGKSASAKKMATSSQKDSDALFHIFDSNSNIPGN